MMLIGAVTWFRGALIIVAQIVGAIASAAVVSALFPGPLGVKTTLSDDTSVVRGLFIEMFLTAELVFTIFMLAAEKHKANFIAPIGIGLALFIGELSGMLNHLFSFHIHTDNSTLGIYYTGGSMNPARSFGPAVIIGDWHGYHWIYWVGPGLGAMVAVGFYKLIKVLEYETVNPPADVAEKEAEKFIDEDMPKPVTNKTRHNYNDSNATGTSTVNGNGFATSSPSASYDPTYKPDAGIQPAGHPLSQTYSPPQVGTMGGISSSNRVNHGRSAV
jgi:aquaporin related protein